MNPAHVIHDPLASTLNRPSTELATQGSLRKFAVRSAVTGEEDNEYFYIYLCICICMLVSGILWEV